MNVKKMLMFIVVILISVAAFSKDRFFIGYWQVDVEYDFIGSAKTEDEATNLIEDYSRHIKCRWIRTAGTLSKVVDRIRNIIGESSQSYDVWAVKTEVSDGNKNYIVFVWDNGRGLVTWTAELE